MGFRRAFGRRNSPEGQPVVRLRPGWGDVDGGCVRGVGYKWVEEHGPSRMIQSNDGYQMFIRSPEISYLCGLESFDPNGYHVFIRSSVSYLVNLYANLDPCDPNLNIGIPQKKVLRKLPTFDLKPFTEKNEAFEGL